jgi:SAM-dependent methyltransferase
MCHCIDDYHDIAIDRDRYGLLVDVRQCVDCNGVYLGHRPTDAWLASWYRSGEFRRWVAWHEERDCDLTELYHRACVYGAELGARLWPAIRGRASGAGWQEPIRVLDFGAANGGVVDALRLLWTQSPYGKGVVQVDARGLGFEADGADLRDALKSEWEAITTGKKQQLDLILLCQTIDHLPDPLSVLRDCYAFTETYGTRLWVDFLVWDEQTVKIDHPFYVSKDTAKALLRRAGFALELAAHEITPRHIGYLCRPV